MAVHQLNPGNDLVRTVLLESVDAGTGVTTPVTTGTVTAFLTATSASTATAADPSLTANGVYVGGANGFAAGTWLFTIDGDTLDPDALDFATLFPAGVAYFIVERPGSIRVYEKLKVVDARAAVIAN